MSKKILKLSILLILSSVLLSACTINWPWKKKAAPVSQEQSTFEQSANGTASDLTKQLKKFSDDNDLKLFLQANSNSSNFSSAGASILASSSPFANYRADSRDTSAPDIIKIDGDYTYSIVRNNLIISKIRPVNDAKEISKINLDSRPQGIIVNGSSLIVFGTDTQAVSKKFRRQNTYTFLKVYDLSDPVNPKLARDLVFEGAYSNARLVGDYVYFLTDTPGSFIEGEPLLPRVIQNGEIFSYNPETFYLDIAYSSFKYVNISTINVRDNNEALSGQVYLLDRDQDLYVSPNNVYITYADGVNEYNIEQAVKRELVSPKLSSEDTDKIAKIEASADFILNSSEKKFKSGVIIDNYINSLNSDDKSVLQASIDESVKQKIGEQEKKAGKTTIYRFSLGNKMAYEAIGEVNGQIIDQYSMDENSGYLRVATVLKSQGDDSQTADFYSNIYILDRDLKAVGALENLATSAQITAARFMGGRAYLSTAKIEDPLFIIGLSDQTKPAVLGAVKIPAVYKYLFPLDSEGNRLISFGKNSGDASSGGDVASSKGLKLSVFDFSDLIKPKELDNYTIGDETSDSIVLNDPSTLNYIYSDAKNYLSIPATLREKGSLSFVGAYVFSLADGRFVLKGKVDHSYGGHFTGSDTENGINYYDNTVKRSLFFSDSEDAVITFSNKLLKINKLSDMSSIKSLILTSDSDDYIITQPASSQAPVSSNPGDSANTELPISPSAGTIPTPTQPETSMPTGSNPSSSITPTSTTFTPLMNQPIY